MDSEDLLNAHDSFSKDFDLSNDPNIPNSFLPSYHPETGSQKIKDAYFPSSNLKIKDTGSNNSMKARSLKR